MSTPTVTHWISSTQARCWHENACPDPCSEEGGNLILSAATEQTWEGLGASFNELGCLALASLEPDQRRWVMAQLFHPTEGCGLNWARVGIGANDFARSWYSLNETDGDYEMRRFSIDRDRRVMIPAVKLALECRPDLMLFGSPWSPPTWMKHPRAYNYGTLVWDDRTLRAYALYFLKFVQAYRAEGIKVAQVHVQNEPNSDQKFPSCLWTGEKMRDFIRDYLGPLFRDSNEACEIWAGTIERDDYNAWANTILTDPRARAYVSGVSYQWAGRGSVRRTHESWPGLRLMQSENECGDGDNSWEYAEYVFDLFQHYISSGVVIYMYWSMMLAPGGRSTWGWEQNSMITIDPQTRQITLNPEFYVMKHFSRFIAPGAVRIAPQGPWTGNSVAFTNPDGSRSVVVHNPFAEPRPLALKCGDACFAFELAPRSFNTVCLTP
ncbi:glycoside hydrolase family 30 beta sandwich domain-containing protein [Verrucomicrobiota bacterium]